MYRSYFFALLACALFSVGALLNAYSNLPQVENSLHLAENQSVENLQVETSLVENPLVENQAAVVVESSDEQTAEPEPDPWEPAASSIPVSSAAPAASPAPVYSAIHTPPGDQTPIASGKPVDSSEALNAKTDNFNLLILGTDGDKLEMVCVFSLNPHLIEELKSVSLFFPVNSLVIYRERNSTLEDLYCVGDWQAVTEAVADTMSIDFNHYIKIDRQALRDLEKYFDPIYVDGELVEMETLFIRRTSHNDDRIIAGILRQVLRPQVFFRYIPGLVFGVNRGLESDFSFTPGNLADYYKIGKHLSTKRIEKIVLKGTTKQHKGRKVNIPPQETLENAIFHTTQ